MRRSKSESSKSESSSLCRRRDPISRPSPRVLGGLLILGLFVAAAGGAQTEVPFGVIISEQAQASFTLLGAGARATGMGGAFTAIADDATAASFNPAGLAQLLVPEASIVLDSRSVSDDFVGFTSFDQVPPLPLTDSSTDFDRTRLNFLAVTMPVRWGGRRFAFQFSSQEIVDFTYRADLDFFETDPSGTPLFELMQTTRQAGGVRLYSASAAFEATQRALIGVTINRWDGDWGITSLNREGPVGSTDTEQFLYHQENSLNGWNLDLGVLLRYRRVNVGLRYRLPFDAAYRIDAQLETDLPTNLLPIGRVRTDLSWPATINAGIAFRPTDRWTLAVDWSQTDWSQMEFKLPGAAQPINFFDLVPRASTGAREANTWRAGAEYLFLRGKSVLPVRFGWFREPQPVTDAVTGDRMLNVGWSVGGGIKRGALSVDVALTHKTSDTRISRFLEPDEIVGGVLRATSAGHRERAETSVLVSLIIQVPSDSSLARKLRWLFIGPPTDGGGS